MITTEALFRLCVKTAKRESDRRLAMLAKYKVAPLVNGKIPKGRNTVIIA